jgi:hypothetical protein
MKFLKRIFDFYLNTSIHVAVAVFSLVQITKLDLNISTNLNVDFFIFFGTVLGYNFLKYAEVFKNKIFTFQKNYLIVLVSLIAIFGMIFYFFELEKRVQIAFLKIGFVVLSYPFLRKYGFLKMFVVAFCVTYITAFIPEIKYKLNWLYLLQRFLIVICLLIPLEICDLQSDSKTLKTLPKIIGIRNLKILGYGLLVIFWFLKLKFDIDIDIDIVIAIGIAIFIFFSDQNKSKYYTSFWVESVPIIWWILLVFFKQI